jgi:L-iditol 2-dehydrogenase
MLMLNASAASGSGGALMRVARLHGVGDLRMADEPVPVAGPGESLVRVSAVGICGSDLHWYGEAGIGDARLDAPLVIGHEFAGVVEGGPRDGQRVAVDPAIPCQSCPTCLSGDRNLCPSVVFAGHGRRDGGLREYLAWPTALLFELPVNVTDADGAMLEPLGVAIHAMDLGHLRVGSSVGVFGAGPIGLLLVQLARAAGAGHVVAMDPLAHRREAALRFGADAVLGGLSADGTDNLGDLGLDVTFEVAGTDEAVHSAMLAARPGARVVIVGIPDSDRTTFPASLARRKGLTLVLARRMNDVYPRAIELVRRGTVDVASLITHAYPLESVDEAFQCAANRTGLKVVVRPPGAG